MTTEPTTLHMLCGKICSGKSTLARKLGDQPSTITIGEGQWLAALYGTDMQTVADYLRYAPRLKRAMKPHINSILQSGVSVVLDFPANTLKARGWMKGILIEAGCEHNLHFIDVADHICKERLQIRNTSGAHEFAAGDSEFDELTNYFEAPTIDEGFGITAHAE